MRSFRIQDILDNDFPTPLNALEQLTCRLVIFDSQVDARFIPTDHARKHINPCSRKAFGRSGREFSAILGQNSQIKKKRKNRTAFTTYQLNELEKRFNYQKYLTPSDRDVIAEQLGLTSTQVNWINIVCLVLLLQTRHFKRLHQLLCCLGMNSGTQIML